LIATSDTPSCGITDDCHSDDSRGVIYDCNILIIQASQWFNLNLLKKINVKKSLKIW